MISKLGFFRIGAVFALVLVLASFQNCSKALIATHATESTQFKSEANAVDAPAALTAPQIKAAPPLADQEDDQAYTGACSVFAPVPLVPLVISSIAPDQKVVRDIGKVVIDEARRVEIYESFGKVTVKAADSVTIANSIQIVQVNANEVPYVKNFLGPICVRALKVGKMENAITKAKIIAQEIEEIDSSVALIHVYGAVVKKVSGSVAGVCLHDGATVLDVTNSRGFVGDCSKR